MIFSMKFKIKSVIKMISLFYPGLNHTHRVEPKQVKVICETDVVSVPLGVPRGGLIPTAVSSVIQ